MNNAIIKEEHNGYMIEIDEEGEIFLTSIVSLEIIWLTELLQYSYKQPEIALSAAKNWIDNVPHQFLEVLTRGQTLRFDHETECGDGCTCEEVPSISPKPEKLS